MKTITITRDHAFENRLVFAKLTDKCLYVAWEKDEKPRILKKKYLSRYEQENIENWFLSEDWEKIRNAYVDAVY